MTVTTTEEDSKIDIPILKKNLEGKQAHRYQNHHSHNTIEKNQKGKEKETARRQRMVETKEVESTPSHGYRTRTEM